MPTSTPSLTRPKLIAILLVALVAIGGVIWAILAANPGAQAIPEAQLPDTTELGAVELRVHDLETMQQYYVDAVGLEVLEETEDQVTLGYDEPVLELTRGGEEPFASAEEAGLYHSAILYPDEASLASTMYQLATVAPQSFQGSADHAVSLAFYFVDPEGNGLELYVDTDPESWKWVEGEVQMGSAPLDPNAFIQEHLSDTVSDATMGHVHLKVGDLERAEAFYADTLGFAVTSRADGALFYAVGGYHHHLATNTWMSSGAQVRDNETGLGSVTIAIPDELERNALVDRLESADHEYAVEGETITTQDPWGNEIRIVLQR